jgi:hypothetical protein
MDDLGARLARFEEPQRYASLEKASDKNAHNVQIVHESLNQLIAYHKKELVPSCRRLREHASALRNAYSCMAAMVREEVARQTAHGNANTRTFALQVYDR